MSFAGRPVVQVGCVVDDMAAAERWYRDYFAVPRWERMNNVEFPPERTFYRGKPADFAINVSLGYSGAQQIELIQPVRGINLYTEYLERHGPGVHHLALVPADFHAALAQARRDGIEIVQQGGTETMDYAYLETPGTGTHYVELMRLSPQLLVFFDSLRAEVCRP